MKLVYVSHGNIPSKWAHTFQQVKQAEAFARLGLETSLVTQRHYLHRFRPRFDYERWYGVTHPFQVVELDSWRGELARVQTRVYARGFATVALRHLRRSRPDLVFSRFHRVLEGCIGMGIPTVFETHRPDNDARFKDLLRIAERPELLGVVTITEPLAGRYESWGLPAHKILVFPDAVDLPEHEASPSDLRARHGIGEDEFVALYCGHLYEEKGIQTVTEAARIAPEIHFVVVGGWDADVRRFRKQLSQLSNLHFTGFVPNREVPSHLGAASVLLLPNSARFPASEVTSPMKMFEYMASGRPIIASKLPVFAPFLHDHRNCWLFEPDDPADLIERLRHGRSYPDKGRELAARALEDVKQYTWARRAEAILDFVGRCGGPGREQRRD